jgi:hypothetical protein
MADNDRFILGLGLPAAVGLDPTAELIRWLGSASASRADGLTWTCLRCIHCTIYGISSAREQWRNEIRWPGHPKLSRSVTSLREIDPSLDAL